MRHAPLAVIPGQLRPAIVPTDSLKLQADLVSITQTIEAESAD